MSKSKSKKKPKPKLETEGFDFYVVEQENNPGNYLVGLNQGQPEWGTDIDAAFWSLKGSKVLTFISQNNIQNATAAGHNGVHPSQRPPF